MSEGLQEDVGTRPGAAGRGAASAKKKAGNVRRLRGFYADALTEAERADFIAAHSVEGLDHEIALLRLRLKQAVAVKPADIALMLRGVEILARLVANRYRLPTASIEDLSAAMRAALESAGLPLEEGVASK